MSHSVSYTIVVSGNHSGQNSPWGGGGGAGSTLILRYIILDRMLPWKLEVFSP